MAQIEIEVKSLLGSKEAADKLIGQLGDDGFDLSNVKVSSQLNHYFTIEDLELFKNKVPELVEVERRSELDQILDQGANFSVRTRESNDKVIFVIKASVDEQTSSNGVTRLEFEQVVGMSLQGLDDFLLESGLAYQAKWSRHREEYSKDGINVCIDKNAGYGYLAEFEMVVSESDDPALVKNKLSQIMDRYGVQELHQERLARMFAHYNAHWPEYYGTDNLFVIE